MTSGIGYAGDPEWEARERRFEDERLDALALSLVRDPELGKRLWSHWSDQGNRNFKGKAWLHEMRTRIERVRALPVDDEQSAPF